MIIKTKTGLRLFPLLILAIVVQGCFLIKYSNPKSESEVMMLSKLNEFLGNIASQCNDDRKHQLQDIDVSFVKYNFTISTNSSMTKFLFPESNEKSTFSDGFLDDFLEKMCLKDDGCKSSLSEYLTIYYSIHELYHIVNVERYNKRHPESFVKHPTKKKKMMSFEEELRAERIVVKYLQLFDQNKLEEFKISFSNLLDYHNFERDFTQVKHNWDTFKNESMDMFLTKIYFFTYCAEEKIELTMDDLLFH